MTIQKSTIYNDYIANQGEAIVRASSHYEAITKLLALIWRK